MQLQIAPSLLSADFLNLERDVRMLNACADLIHLDIMDGSFVPNISFGFPVVKAIAGAAEIPLDAHLMTVHPRKWFDILAGCGVSMVSFHLETAGADSSDFIREIHRLGMKAGIAVNPDVPVEKLFPYVGEADFFLVMSVFAGFGGQKFIPESLKRIAALKGELESRNSDAVIEVDGGVSLSNAASIRDAGASILVAGSTVFGAESPSRTVMALREV